MIIGRLLVLLLLCLSTWLWSWHSLQQLSIEGEEDTDKLPSYCGIEIRWCLQLGRQRHTDNWVQCILFLFFTGDEVKGAGSFMISVNCCFNTSERTGQAKLPPLHFPDPTCLPAASSMSSMGHNCLPAANQEHSPRVLTAHCYQAATRGLAEAAAVEAV